MLSPREGRSQGHWQGQEKQCQGQSHKKLIEKERRTVNK